MSIGVTQLILIIIIGILLFGNIPKIFKDVGTGIQAFKKTVSKESNDEVTKKHELESHLEKEKNKHIDFPVLNEKPRESSKTEIKG